MIANAVLLAVLSAAPLGSPSPAGADVLVAGEWLESNLQRSDLVILHVGSSDAEYRKSHLPGARFFPTDWFVWEGETGMGAEFRPWERIEGALERVGVSDGTTVVVYGDNASLAARLWMTLDVLGAGGRPPLFLDGGIPVWTEEGRAVSTEIPAVSPGRLTLRPQPSRLVRAEWILARLGHEDVALLDARSQEEFAGVGEGMGAGVSPGHIPGARQLYWEELIEAPERPRFRPRAELAELFARAGAAQGDLVVTYCGTGMAASLTYLAGRMLGYDVRLYDGSWKDWGSRADYPVMPRVQTSKPRLARGAGLGSGGR